MSDPEAQPLLSGPGQGPNDHAASTYYGGTAAASSYTAVCRITTSRLRIASMCCPREGELVKELLVGPVAGVLDVKVNACMNTRMLLAASIDPSSPIHTLHRHK